MISTPPSLIEPADTVVQFSAGWDSTAALLLAASQPQHYGRILALHVDTGAPYSAIEFDRAARLYARLLPRFHSLHAFHCFVVPLLCDPAVPYIASRNLMLGAVSVHVAELCGAERIVTGSKTEDMRPDDPYCFRDGTRDFYSALSNVASVSVGRRVTFESPLAGWSKAGVYRLLRAADIDTSAQLWTCYAAGPEPCGTCYHCREAEKAISEGVPA
jgi:7-cyano-7-deazaguanine synthase in queuosine biosynthesis